MGVKLGKSSTVHAERTADDLNGSTECGRDSVIVTATSAEVTCKSCIKITEKRAAEGMASGTGVECGYCGGNEYREGGACIGCTPGVERATAARSGFNCATCGPNDSAQCGWCYPVSGSKVKMVIGPREDDHVRVMPESGDKLRMFGRNINGTRYLFNRVEELSGRVLIVVLNCSSPDAVAHIIEVAKPIAAITLDRAWDMRDDHVRDCTDCYRDHGDDSVPDMCSEGLRLSDVAHKLHHAAKAPHALAKRLCRVKPSKGMRSRARSRQRV